VVERAAGARELRLVASVGVSDGCGGEVLHATGGNDGGDSFNKLAVFPVKVEARLLFPFFSGHRGGGWRKKERRRAGLCSLGRSSSSMVFETRQRRPLRLSAAGPHRLAIEYPGRRAALSLPPDLVPRWEAVRLRIGV
jgi:hypothetical protein